MKSSKAQVVSTPFSYKRPAHARSFQKASTQSTMRLFLVGLIAMFGAILLAPFLPKLWFWLFHPKINDSPYKNAAAHHGAPPANKPGNRLVLPDIGIDAQIIEGASVYILDQHDGVWHEPGTEDPTKTGNMVIAAHRFSYKPHISNFFYNLTELKSGQHIYLVWNKRVYDYEIFKTETVMPNRVDIRNDDRNIPHLLTLYTCTPLGSTAKRYVVRAKGV